MKRKKIILLLILYTLTDLVFAQGKVENENIVIGKIDRVQSTILGEKRKIWVYVPDKDEQSNELFPVMYLLDGDAHFSSVVGMTQQLSTINGNMIFPKMIVVGILNTDRTRDLTPTQVDIPSFKTSGGAENFISFLEKELIPYIEGKYPAAPYKMFIGHSFGGLTVMHTFVHHNNLFNSYICIDPSLWWDNEKLLKQTEMVLSEKRFTGKSLYLSIANTLYDDMEIEAIQKDTTSNTKYIRSVLSLNAEFEKNKQNGLRYRGKYYPDDTHSSVPLITVYDGLRFLFDFYRLNLTMKDLTDTTGTVAAKYKNHFAQISENMGYQIKPDEDEINYAGYEFLRSNIYKTAESFFKLNIEYYPDSFNVYDSYGDYFIAIGDKENAIIQFKRALSIEENEASRKKLNELEDVKE